MHLHDPTADFIPSVQKRIYLGRNLIFLEFCVVLIFMALHFILSLNVSLYIYAGFLSITLIQFTLYHFRYYAATSFFSLISFNLAIFVVASSESHNTGLYLHFVSAGTAALAVFGYQKWIKGLFFTGLSLGLFLVLHLTDISILPYRVFTPTQERLFLVINACTMAFASVSCILLLLKINSNSEKSLLQNQLIIKQQYNELKKTNSELDRFVYSASHDLRAPLSSISGLVQLVLNSNMDSHEAYMHMIQNRVEAMDKFIGEIIDYSRNARVEVEHKPIQLKSLVCEVWETLNYFQGSDQVQFVVDMDHELTLISDPYRLKVILNNLLANSIKYADHKKDSFVKVTSQRINGVVDICIEDNGIGIHPEHHSRVFDMFYRATESSKGSGLGLFIVLEAINKMNGSIRMNSELGKGTAFTISLPSAVPTN